MTTTKQPNTKLIRNHYKALNYKVFFKIQLSVCLCYYTFVYGIFVPYLYLAIIEVQNLGFIPFYFALNCT